MQQNTTVDSCADIQKKHTVQYLLALLGAFALYIVFVSLNVVVESNIVFDGLMLYELTEWAYLGLELFAFFVAYAYLIYAVFQGLKNAFHYAWIYVAATCGRQVILYLLNWLFFGLKTEDMLFQALMTVITILLELTQYAAVFVIAYLLTRRFDVRIEMMNQGAIRLQKTEIDRQAMVFPQRKLPVLNDPLRGSTLLAAVLIGVLRVANRMSYDLSYGAPTDLGDLMWMILYYTVDVLIGVACYFVLLFIIRRLAVSEQK